MSNNTQFELLLVEYLPPLEVPEWNESLSKLFIYQIHSFQKEPNVDFAIGYWNKIGSIGGGGQHLVLFPKNANYLNRVPVLPKLGWGDKIIFFDLLFAH